MDAFTSRLSLAEVSDIFQTATKRNLLDGSNAALFHHLGLMSSRLAVLKESFPRNCLHTVAIKANPLVEILREIARLDFGLEAASIEEVTLALAAGCPPDRIVYDSPAKTVAEIRRALQWGVYLNADSFDELDRIAALRCDVDTKSLVGLRINSMVGAGTIDHTSVSAANSKFGIPLTSERNAIIAAFAKHDWLTGLHVHVGSQGCKLELLGDAAVRIAVLRRDLQKSVGRQISHVDIGGGLSTSYETGQIAPTPAEYCALIQQRSPELFHKDVRLITEFGRAIHANCGFAVSRVEYLKPAQRCAVIHLGADLLLRPVYRPESWRHELFVLDPSGRPKSGPHQEITIAGPLCFSGDIIARNAPLPPVEVGDWIVIRDVGAYTLSMWSRHCSRGIPAVWGYNPVRSDSLRLLRRAETGRDIVRFWNGDDGAESSAASGYDDCAGRTASQSSHAAPSFDICGNSKPFEINSSC